MPNNDATVKVSILITCYNLQNFIEEAILSLLQQQCHFNYEIIVVDDASTDNSKQVIAGITDPRLHFINLDKNVGAPAAINLAWAKARGEYMCRFDGDDKWHPSYLQEAAKVLDENPDAVLVHTDVSFIDEHGRITSEKNNIDRPAALKPLDNEFAGILEKYYINAPAIMARKSAWDKVLPWQERFRPGLGDWFCTLLMLEQQASFFINQPLAYYRIHTSNMHRAMIKDRSAETNTVWILDFFRNRKNAISPAQWKHIYFAQNRHLAFAYFFHGMDADTLRCLNRAVSYQPSALLTPSFFRIWVASFIGKKWYNKAKSLFSSKKN